MGKYDIGVRVADPDGDTGVIVKKANGLRTIKYDDFGFTAEWRKDRLKVVAPAVQLQVEPAVQLEVDKEYCTRDGKRVAIIEGRGGYFVGDNYYHYKPDGECAFEGRFGNESRRPLDIVGEWAEPAAPPSVATPARVFIVARVVDGKPRPGTRPFVHTSLADAGEEAQRLADLHGDDFVVFEQVATHSIDAGPVPLDFNLEEAKAGNLWGAFVWAATKQRHDFWSAQAGGLTPRGRAILRKWIAEAEAQKVAA